MRASAPLKTSLNIIRLHQNTLVTKAAKRADEILHTTYMNKTKNKTKSHTCPCDSNDVCNNRNQRNDVLGLATRERQPDTKVKKLETVTTLPVQRAGSFYSVMDQTESRQLEDYFEPRIYL